MAWDDGISSGEISQLDLRPLQKVLTTDFVLGSSMQILELLTGRYLRHANYRTMLRTMPGENPRCMHACDLTVSLHWESLAMTAVEAKARDICKKLSEATAQLPDGRPNIVHIGFDAVESLPVARRISMATRNELIDAIRERYRAASTVDKTKILDEFVELTGHHRKHASWPLANRTAESSPNVARYRVYCEDFRQVLIVFWEAGDRVCGKRLKALIPLLSESMEKHGHLQLESRLKALPLQDSAPTAQRPDSPAQSTNERQ